MQFNTQLLHGKSIVKNPSKEMLPPISQVTAYQYESMEELEKGVPFPKAAQDFIRWCGNDFVFCTWGDQDVMELQRKIEQLQNAENGGEQLSLSEIQSSGE